ncbi:MAG: hypothetical protein WB762_10965, partial [Candidatus Sulfotelmatobacter sp.]
SLLWLNWFLANPIQRIRGLSLSHTWRYLPLGQQLAREFGQQWWGITPAWWILVCETTLAMAALYFTLFTQKPIIYSLALLLAHYGFWAYYIWPALSEPSFFTPRLVAVTSVAAGVCWVVYARANMAGTSVHTG